MTLKVFVESEIYRRHEKLVETISEGLTLIEEFAKIADNSTDGIARIIGLVVDPPESVSKNPFAYRGKTGHEDGDLPLMPVIPESLQFVPGRTAGELIYYEDFRREQVGLIKASRHKKRWKGFTRGQIDKTQPGVRGVRQRWLEFMRKNLPRRRCEVE